jgi:hypothetical protein
MATAEQRARRRAQRQTASRVRSKTLSFPKELTRGYKQARIDYGNRVLNGQEPYPEFGTPEARQLASLASLAYHNKGNVPPEFLAAFEQYFYHDEMRPDVPQSEDIEYYDEDEE